MNKTFKNTSIDNWEKKNEKKAHDNFEQAIVPSEKKYISRQANASCWFFFLSTS